MAGEVSFGSLSTTGGVTRFTGSSSQIDTGKLVDSLVEARRLPSVRLEAKITRNEAKIAAYDELKGLLQDLKSSVASLRNPPGFLGLRENLFERKEVFYSADTATSPATLLSVAATNEVASGKFEVVVEQLAAARKFSSGSAATADQTLAQAFNGGAAFTGSFTIGLAGAAGGATIAVTGDMDVHDLKAAINAQGAAAGVTASVVKVADNDHRLVVTATATGKEVVLASAGGDDVLALTGLSADGGTSFAHPLAVAREARVRIDGVVVSRSGNQITD
ncbi:MAG TPA: flagellar cap protein FliD N-terminal domain-containing protein, partial [Geminicoccaceae bacterium]